MHAHTTLAFVDAERGRVELALRHAERARHAVGTIGTRRSWLGANASAALGVARAAEGRLVDAERELARAEHLFSDDVPTIHHTWLLLVLAGVRVRRGHLDDAHSTLGEAREALAQLPDSGRLPAMADAVEAELAEASRRARHGELLEPPSEAELSVLRLLATDLSVREIGERLFLSPNTIRTHRRLLYRKLGVHTRTDAVARATALGLLEKRITQGEAPRFGATARRRGQAGYVATKTYRLIVEDELSDHMAATFQGMTLTHVNGNTALTGAIRDQSELQGLLQRVSGLGLTLLDVSVVAPLSSRR